MILYRLRWEMTVYRQTEEGLLLRVKTAYVDIKNSYAEFIKAFSNTLVCYNLFSFGFGGFCSNTLPSSLCGLNYLQTKLQLNLPLRFVTNNELFQG